MNIALLSPVSLPEKGFPRKRRKIDANLDDKAFEFFFFFAILSLVVCLCCLLWMHVFEHKISYEVLTFGGIL